ncbi:SDR family NAD(P)-dependent oxidoreductase [Sinomonas sp. ASV322]|uniref:SDR family NAD(P)-dependent oxidoreductase n=1 Tax=Sinomonas sp. ASV322 TaxID=3041920 RepID=UPI0027DD47D1|nr:SDR family NAD(P)-dependent oxidoreductase [Sinomonas sp. ASV322]MDQ4503593.1 SDR family NAD(P)-dependent oxidoreductase [Sinomonas sp. ASV322]
MARIFITGSTQGLGRGAAEALLGEGHDVVLHARTRERAASLGELAARAAGVVVGDLSHRDETLGVAEQVNALARMDAVIHNAGVYTEPGRHATPEGHPRVLAVNVLAPYLLTALIGRPARLVYLSSGLHRGGDTSLRDVEWAARPWDGYQAYSDSKLYVTALALAVARRWPEVRSNAVDPGWVPTRMGGPSAPDDLELGHATQAWLAGGGPEADVTGGYWYHGRRREPAAAAADPEFQDAVLAELAGLTGVELP